MLACSRLRGQHAQHVFVQGAGLGGVTFEKLAQGAHVGDRGSAVVGALGTQ